MDQRLNLNVNKSKGKRLPSVTFLLPLPTPVNALKLNMTTYHFVLAK